MQRKIAIEIICFLFVLLFLYAALNKIMDYPRFKMQIGQSPLLTAFGDILPATVILIEVAVSVLLVIPRLRLFALFISFSLMTMFTVYIIAILTLSPYVPCSCGGVLENMGWTEHIYFNSAFILIGAAGIALESMEKDTLVKHAKPTSI